MSLLLTSNTPSNDIGTEAKGINRPFSYQNHLQDTFTIPKNAEVAVQSVKVNRQGSITLPENTRFGIFYGEQIPPGVFNNEDINSIVVSTRVATQGGTAVNIQDGAGTLDIARGNASDIAEFIQNAGNRALCHPNLCENASSLINPGFTCSPKRSASDTDFLGWDMKITSAPQTSNGSQNISQNWFSQTDADQAGSWTWNNVTKTLENVGGDDTWFTGTDYPLSLAGGAFNCSINFTGKYKEIGLVRGIFNVADNTGRPQEPSSPPWWDGDDNEFMDWKVIIRPAGTITVEHACPNALQDELEFLEYDYRAQNNGAYLNALTDNITRVSFVIHNEKVDIFAIRTGAGATTYQLTEKVLPVAPTVIRATNNASNVKPTNMNTRWLYPKVYLEDGDDIGIHRFDGLDIKGHYWGGVNPDTIQPTYQDWYNLMAGAENIPGAYGTTEDANLELVKRIDCDFKNMIPGNFFGYRFLNADLQLDYDPIIVSGVANKYFLTESLNAQRFLGFTGRSWAESNTQNAGTPFTYNWESDETPELKASNSVFIRLKNFNINSVNFSKSQHSNILYHLPAFSNTGLSTGSLFFEPTERTYLKLNNTVEEFISTVEVDMVYADETLARDLTGKTVVMFHIREAR